MNEERFVQDVRHELCSFCDLHITELQPILDWINAPPNLQQFLPAITNLIEILQAGLQLPFLSELHFDTSQGAHWISTLTLLSNKLSTELPIKLKTIEPNRLVRPDGIIGTYPEYASLIGANPQYPQTWSAEIRSLHFIALCSAAGYRAILAEGKISKPTTGIEQGMRDLRDLEQTAKRPKILRTETAKYSNLDELIERLSHFINEQRKALQSTWGAGLRLLFSSFHESKEGYTRHYRERMHSVGRIVHQDHDDHDDKTNNPIYVSLVRNSPDERSASKLKKIGLHPEEMAGIQAIVIHEKNAPATALNDISIFRQRQRGRLQGIIKQAQQLPSQWNIPTDYEIEALVRAFSAEHLPAEIGGQLFGGKVELIALLNLMLWTGRSMEHIQTLRGLQSKKDYVKRTDLPFAYLSQERLLAIPITTPHRKRGIDEIDRALLEDTRHKGAIAHQESTIFIALPEQATNQVHSFYEQWSRSRKRKNETTMFRSFQDQHRTEIGNFLKWLNKAKYTRWTERRLSTVLTEAILRTTGDLVYVQLITQRQISHSEVSAHYQCTDLFFLEQIVYQSHYWLKARLKQSAEPELLNSSHGEIHSCVGSPYAVTDELVGMLSEHLKNQLRSALRQPNNNETLIVKHNSFTAYIVHWLGFVSGYRAVCDPLTDPLQIDRQTGLLVISDKDDHSYHHTRIVPLPLRFIEQLDCYVEHLQTLHTKLDQYPKLQRQVQKLCQRYLQPEWNHMQSTVELPFLFFLNEHYKAKSISPKTLKPYNPTRLPPNIDRHYLRSKLSQLGCPAEIIDYFMGHWERGEEPYHRYSLTSPLLIATELAPYLDTISQHSGWTVQKGLYGG